MKRKMIALFTTLFACLCSTTFAADYTLPLTSRQLCDLELILNGGFAPLQGFLNEEDYTSVVNNMRLSSGTVWTMPIVLDISEDLAMRLEEGDCLHLIDREHNELATLTVQQWWAPNKEHEALCVYGTTSFLHPGVAYLFQRTQNYYVSGPLEKKALPHHYCFEDLRKTPRELKAYFQEKGCKKVVAFQTRNPMHRAHVELTKRAMEQTGAHLLIQPIVGLTKPGDIDAYTRVSCYRKVLPYYPTDGVTLSVLPLAMRMAGPREAVWHAIIRKNCGATHFIVGRDHAGPGNDENGQPFYDPFAAQDLVKKFASEIGIEMIPFQEVVYVEAKDSYCPRDELQEGDQILNISGTQLRRCLYENLDIPAWFSYPEVIKELRKSYPGNQKKGICLFFTGLSGAGKTTLSQALCEKLQEIQKRPVTLIDGDTFRKQICAELSFTKEDRSKNIHRVGFVANEIARNRGLAICAFIAPYEEDRAYVRNLVGQSEGDFVEIYLSTPLSTCEKRDVKGLYKKARAGQIREFTGIDDPYEAPNKPELTIDTSEYTIQEALEIILDYLKEHKYI